MNESQINGHMITAALWGRIARNELENSPYALAVAISKQTEVPLGECVKLVVQSGIDAMHLALCSSTNITTRKPAVKQ